MHIVTAKENPIIIAAILFLLNKLNKAGGKIC